MAFLFRFAAYTFLFGSGALIFGLQYYLVGAAWATAAFLCLEMAQRMGGAK